MKLIKNQQILFSDFESTMNFMIRQISFLHRRFQTPNPNSTPSQIERLRTCSKNLEHDINLYCEKVFESSMAKMLFLKSHQTIPSSKEMFRIIMNNQYALSKKKILEKLSFGKVQGFLNTFGFVLENQLFKIEDFSLNGELLRRMSRKLKPKSYVIFI